MASWIIYFFFTLTLSKSALPCQGRDKPLILTPYIDKNMVELARNLSRVDKSCLKEFVPDSYAGYITANQELEDNLFFWFFPATEDPDAPVLLWLNGGPTVSSMLGLFWENGPMSVEGDGDTSATGYSERKYAWTKSFSMLYVDNPVGVGFSFSKDDSSIIDVSQKKYIDELDSFLHQFFELYPEFKSKELYIGGQSYAGKYISALGYRIHSKIQAGTSNINLTGVYLGAPFYDPETQIVAHYDFLYSHGVITHKQWVDSKQTASELPEQLKKEDGPRTTSNLTFVVFTVNPFGNLDNYVTAKAAGYDIISDLLSSDKIRFAINVGDREYEDYSGRIQHFDSFGEDWMISTKNEMAVLMNHYKVLIFNGDYDVVVSSPMVEAAIMATPWVLQENYNNATRHPWNRAKDVIGFHSLTGKFCRVVVHGAGHQVPHDVPDVTLLMMRQFIRDGCVSDIEKGHEDGVSGRLTNGVSSISSSQFIFKSIISFIIQTFIKLSLLSSSTQLCISNI